MGRFISISISMIVCILVPVGVLAQDTLLVSWTETPGLLESTIKADTTADGSQAHDVYLLEANKIYLQRTELEISVDLGTGGHGQAVVWTCDLSEEYVHINADYRT